MPSKEVEMLNIKNTESISRFSIILTFCISYNYKIMIFNMLVSSLPSLPKETFAHACSSLNIGGTTVVVVAGYRTLYILQPFINVCSSLQNIIHLINNFTD